MYIISVNGHSMNCEQKWGKGGVGGYNVFNPLLFSDKRSQTQGYNAIKPKSIFTFDSFSITFTRVVAK